MARERSEKGGKIPGLTCCRLCRSEEEGRAYEFWSGFREKSREDRLWGKTRLSFSYSDLKPFQVFVCNRCAAALRRDRYKVKFIAWGVVALLCLLPLGVVPFLGMDRLSGNICLAFFAVPATASGLLFAYYAWQWFRPVPEDSFTDRVVLGRIRQEKEYGKKGYDLFTPSEYADLFESGSARRDR
jgi:hypothetical protein